MIGRPRSILSPGVKSAHPQARVEWIGKLENLSAGRSSSDRLAAGEFVDPPGTLLIRRGIGQVLAVR
jgi:hypothetical protein